jgi:hypothetical protein
MAWCLTLDATNRFKKGLKDGTIDPIKLAAMVSLDRRNFLETFVGAENAEQVNAMFEEKLLLKNQKAGYISWAKKVAGITPRVRQDLMSRIEKMDKVLSPAEGEQFLQDLASTRLRIDVTQEEAKTITDLSKAVRSSREVWQTELDNHPTWTKDALATRKEWATNTDRLKYGADQVALERYVNDLKLQSRSISFKEHPVKATWGIIKELPGAFKASVSSFDNSFWGRQGWKTALDFKTTNIWVRNFLKSWGNIKNQLLAKGKWYSSGDNAVMDAIKADIYSRPNAIAGKYKAGGYGLDVLTEEAFPSMLQERIPGLGRIFKTSEVAFNGGALQLRADLADRVIQMAEKNGINTNDPAEARPIGRWVSSITGRGSLGKAEAISKEINTLLFSVKFLKANVDILTAGLTDPEIRSSPFARKEAGKSLLRILMSIAAIMFLAKMLDKNSSEEDPRSNNFGKVKIFGKWVDVTGGLGGLVHLASQLVPTFHNGKLSFWNKNSKGELTDLWAGKFGQTTPMDVWDSFWQGKLSPAAGVVRDVWKNQTYGGLPLTIWTELNNVSVPMSIQNFNELMKDPNASNIVVSMLLDALGFSVSAYPESNLKSGFIPENKSYKNQDFISAVATYAKAIGTDPETAFNRIFTGQKITRVTNGTVMVERMPLSSSTAIKKKAGANNPTMKLDHTIPLELGGSNDKSNLKLVTTAQWSSYTPVENALGEALDSGKITKQEAQGLIVQFKEGKLTKDQILKRLK